MANEPESFHKVARAEDLPPGAGLMVEVGNEQIALFNFGGAYYATSDMCPHRGASLAEGFLDRGKVFCPWHCFDFDLKTGACEMVPSLRIRVYEVKVEEGEVLVRC